MNNTKSRFGRFGALLLLTSCLAIPVAMQMGCAHGNLEAGGSYAPVATNTDGVVAPTQQADFGFFAVDSAFELAVSAMDTAFSFERNNRLMLWKLSPEVKHALDGIRPQAVAAKQKYAIARAAYLANPVPAGLDSLNAALGEVKSLSAAAAAALPASSAPAVK